jgi:integrase/recombinase XerD
MARVVRKRKPDPPPVSPLAAMMEKHLLDLRVKNYSEYTIKNRRGHIGFSLLHGVMIAA